MSELIAGFQSLPSEYQRVLQLAQDQHQISVAPLQTLVGGWSGAMVYLVSVTHLPSQRVEHFILKLDRKSKTARSDELSRHAAAQSKSPAEFARHHLATLAFERVEAEARSPFSTASPVNRFSPIVHFPTTVNSSNWRRS